MSKVSKKLVCIILAAVLVVGSVVGIVIVMSKQDKVDESKILRIWSAPPLMGEDYESTLKIDPDSYSALYSKFVIDRFKAEFPDITIRYEARGWAEALNENIIRSANVAQPDIIGTETYTQNLIDLDYLAPVEWSDEIKNNLLPFA